MSWYTLLVLCLFSSITTVGSLKRAGWISIHPDRIEHEHGRKAFEAIVSAGQFIADKSFDLYASVRRRRVAAD